MNKELEQIKLLIKENSSFYDPKEGKLIRSKLGLLWLKATKTEITNEIIKFLSSIELIHNASLLHDDVIDNEQTRRNSNTINSQLGNKTAILYGNITLINALKLINNIELYKIITNTLTDMCNGELKQISQLGNIPTLGEYLKKTNLKTTSLFKAIFKGLFELTQKDEFKHAEQFAEAYGNAFQIKNDLNDYKQGIDKSKDIIAGIYTAPIIFINKIETSNIAIEKTISLIDNYKRGALEQLEVLRDNEYKTALIEKIECLTN